MTFGKKSLAIFLPSGGNGGAERMQRNMASIFANAGYKVTFLDWNRRAILCLWPLIKYLREEKPDILLSNLGHNNIIALWAKLLTGASTRVIAVQHNTLSMECRYQPGWQHKILPLLYRLFLPRADGIVAVSNGVADDLARAIDMPRSRMTVIPNPIITPNFEQRMNAAVDHPWLDGETPVVLAVGRLAAQKNFGDLISAFALAHGQKDMRLIILGEGPLRKALQAQAKREGVGACVDLPGYRDPLPFMRRASMLAVASLYEGFSNVVAEALACGLNVVSTSCPHGPAEILENGQFGRLVPPGNIEALASAMLETLEQPMPPETLRLRGNEYTAQRAALAYIRLFEA